MNDSVRFHPQVPHDLAEAIAWYEDVSPDVANRFRRAVRSAFAAIRAQPETYGITFDDVRIARVSRFPYLVQYRIRLEVPYVLGVSQAFAKSGYRVISNDIAIWSKVFGTCYLLNCESRAYYSD